MGSCGVDGGAEGVDRDRVTQWDTGWGYGATNGRCMGSLRGLWGQSGVYGVPKGVYGARRCLWSQRGGFRIPQRVQGASGAPKGGYVVTRPWLLGFGTLAGPKGQGCADTAVFGGKVAFTGSKGWVYGGRVVFTGTDWCLSRPGRGLRGGTAVPLGIWGPQRGGVGTGRRFWGTGARKRREARSEQSFNYMRKRETGRRMLRGEDKFIQ